MRDLITTGVIIFLLASFVNVILSTVKSIMTARSDNSVIVACWSAVAFGFYAVVVKQLATFPVLTSVIVTIVANFFGVLISMALIKKFRKDRTWKISVTLLDGKSNEIAEMLENANISYTKFSVFKGKNEYAGFNIFSESKKQSEALKEILDQGFKFKYNIVEVKTEL